MTFPERPTVHKVDPVFRVSDQIVWRPPRAADPLVTYSYAEPFRTCSYCGSMHPEDLLAALQAGSRLGGSDWKYGWPHKFYIDVINTVNPTESVPIGESIKTSDEPCPSCCGDDGKPRPDLLVSVAEACSCRGKFRKTERTPIMGTRETFHAKWYNEHLEDEGFDEETLAALFAALEQHSGIRFSFGEKEGRRVLKYAAPSYGYQR